MTKIIILILIFFIFINQSTAQNELEIVVTIKLVDNNTEIKPCNLSIGINIENELFDYGEQVKFYNTISNKTSDFQIEYWVEDIFGDIVKKKTITTNLQQKTFTPKFENNQGVFFIKNHLTTNCENEGIIESNKMFVVKNQEFIKDTNANSVESQDGQIAVSKPKITSFYTRTKNFSKNINLFANIQGAGTLILLTNDEKKVIKINNSGLYTLNVTAQNGINNYFLILFLEEEIIDFKELQVVFEETKNTVSDDLKTENNNSLKNSKKDAVINIIDNKTTSKSTNTTLMTGNTVYESKNQKLVKQTPYFLIIVFAIFIVVLIIKHNF